MEPEEQQKIIKSTCDDVKQKIDDLRSTKESNQYDFSLLEQALFTHAKIWIQLRQPNTLLNKVVNTDRLVELIKKVDIYPLEKESRFGSHKTDIEIGIQSNIAELFESLGLEEEKDKSGNFDKDVYYELHEISYELNNVLEEILLNFYKRVSIDSGQYVFFRVKNFINATVRYHRAIFILEKVDTEFLKMMPERFFAAKKSQIEQVLSKIKSLIKESKEVNDSHFKIDLAETKIYGNVINCYISDQAKDLIMQLPEVISIVELEKNKMIQPLDLNVL